MKKLEWIQLKERERGLKSTKLWLHILKWGWSICLVIETLQQILTFSNFAFVLTIPESDMF